MLCQEAIRDPSYAPCNRDADPGRSEGEESALSRLYIEHCVVAGFVSGIQATYRSNIDADRIDY